MFSQSSLTAPVKVFMCSSDGPHGALVVAACLTPTESTFMVQCSLLYVHQCISNEREKLIDGVCNFSVLHVDGSSLLRAIILALV